MTLSARARLRVCAVAALALCTLGLSSVARAQVGMVRINGVATPVYFNDGDTFRIIEGEFRGMPARLAGFNTLESYGPTHQWGDWTYKELYVNSKQATNHARRGFWSCDLDPTEKDGYGRVLAICRDLALAQIRKGLAHAYSIGEPSPMEYIKAQREAIVKRRGMWAKGVPPMVLTSLHSADERLDSTGNYNRLISSLDGLSAKWSHQNVYSECEAVCHPAKAVELEAAKQVIRALRADPSTTRAVHGMEDPYLIALFNEYVTMDRVPEVFELPGGHPAVVAKLGELKAAGVFGALRDINGSCMYYATFERRYIVKPKPWCIKW